MLGFIEKPHLPQSRVKHIIIGEKYRKTLENALIQNNLSPIWLENNGFVDERLSGHCDLMAAHLGGRRIAGCEFLKYSQFINNSNIPDIDLLTVPDPMGKAYPMDAGLNFCLIGNKLIYNPNTANNAVVSELGCEMIPCKQGYTKCSICVVDENTIITADTKIAQIAEENGMEALPVDKGLAALDGFEYGFIGGASFKIARNKMAFTGIIKNAVERNKIESFLGKRGIEAIYLTEHELFDIGSAIPLTEEI
ncbi:MAG: DUF6873 family GME fold protein [Oscillospiraceae bacterium]